MIQDRDRDRHDSDGWDADEPAGARRGLDRRSSSPRRRVLLACGVAAAVAAVLVLARSVSPGPRPGAPTGSAGVGATTEAASSTAGGSDPDVECLGSSPFRPAVLSGRYRDLGGGDAADDALLAAIRRGDAFNHPHPFPTTGWRRIVDLPQQAEWLHEQSPGRADARVTYRLDGAAWVYDSSALGGPCAPARADLAGDDTRVVSVDPSGMTLLVTVDGGACAPHRLELAPADVVETARTVTLTIRSLPSTTVGGFCADAREKVTVPVGLHAPLDSRTVLDGRYFPARPVPLR